MHPILKILGLNHQVAVSHNIMKLHQSSLIEAKNCGAAEIIIAPCKINAVSLAEVPISVHICTCVSAHPSFLPDGCLLGSIILVPRYHKCPAS